MLLVLPGPTPTLILQFPRLYAKSTPPIVAPFNSVPLVSPVNVTCAGPTGNAPIAALVTWDWAVDVASVKVRAVSAANGLESNNFMGCCR